MFTYLRWQHGDGEGNLVSKYEVVRKNNYGVPVESYGWFVTEKSAATVAKFLNDFAV